MKVSADPIARYAVVKLTPINDERMVRLNLLTVTNKKNELLRRLEERMQRQHNGRSLVTALQ